MPQKTALMFHIGMIGSLCSIFWIGKCISQGLGRKQMAHTNRVIRTDLIKKLFTKSRQGKEKQLGMFSLMGSAQWGSIPP